MLDEGHESSVRVAESPQLVAYRVVHLRVLALQVCTALLFGAQPVAPVRGSEELSEKHPGVAPPNGLPNPMQWLDLCALGTLCDMAPLQGVNRAFSRQGLKIMSKDNNPGLRALADVAGIGKIETVYHATFMLGPRKSIS